MAPFRFFFPFGVWIAGGLVWLAALVAAGFGESASAKPRPAAIAKSAAKSSEDQGVLSSRQLESALGDYVSVYRKGARCPSSDCVTLDLHFTALTPEARPRQAGEWISELNTWFHPSRQPRLFVFRFKSWTPYEVARGSGCAVVLPAGTSTREGFAGALKECADPRVVNRNAITVFVTAQAGQGDPGPYGELNDYTPYLRIPVSELADVSLEGSGWKLHRSMREALGLPVGGGGRSPAFSASETPVLLQNVERVYNRISPNESVVSMDFND